MILEIKTLAERSIGSTSTPQIDVDQWMRESVAEEFNCSPDQVDLVQDADEEFLTVDGLPVARLIRRYGWRA